MLSKQQIKLAQNMARDAEKLVASLPLMLSKIEKNLSKEDIELIRNAQKSSNMDANLKAASNAQKDFEQFMKQYGKSK